VSLYTLTKGISAGSYLVGLLLVLLGVSAPGGLLFGRIVPLVALAFFALTGAILIADLEHPARFYMIFTRPAVAQLAGEGRLSSSPGFGAVLAAHLLFDLTGRPHRILFLGVVGLPLAVASAVYTAYLFAQAKARDLWQNPLLPPHLLVQADVGRRRGARAFRRSLGTAGAAAADLEFSRPSALVHALLVLGEITLPHSTAHARLATQEMVSGRFRAYFWTGHRPHDARDRRPAGSRPEPACSAGVAVVGLLSFEHGLRPGGSVGLPLA
jgi:hypothetical protein